MAKQNIPRPIRIAKIDTWKAVIIAIITAISGIVTTYIASPPKTPTEAQLQNVRNLSIEGRWKYVCTDYNDLYQHGGRFEVIKQDNGALQLRGERMWKDIYDTVKHAWNCNDFKGNEIIPWNSIWIYVHDKTQFNMEYEMIDHSIVKKGYCTATIIADKGDVQKIEGYFYQLLPTTPLLAGRVAFEKVTDSDYNNPVWKKNH
ncbi:MAG: hypothetical protein JWO09_138 [Bacteroidetes bacterium]|nr:hypothetical protein [Bacteroidota bacterium]